jgi:hypothetical protein
MAMIAYKCPEIQVTVVDINEVSFPRLQVVTYSKAVFLLACWEYAVAFL